MQQLKLAMNVVHALLVYGEAQNDEFSTLMRAALSPFFEESNAPKEVKLAIVRGNLHVLLRRRGKICLPVLQGIINIYLYEFNIRCEADRVEWEEKARKMGTNTALIVGLLLFIAGLAYTYTSPYIDTNTTANIEVAINGLSELIESTG